MRIAYARVSTEEQNLDRQLDMLEQEGYDKLIQEKFTGTKKDREGLQTLMDIVRDGDVVIIESISRLGRKTLDVLNTVEELKKKGVEIISLKEKMDTSTATGNAMFQMLVVIAELERNMIAERIKEGQNASKKRGKHIGRPKVDSEKLEIALRMHESGDYSVKEIIQTTGISQGSLYKAINERKLKL